MHFYRLLRTVSYSKANLSRSNTVPDQFCRLGCPKLCLNVKTRAFVGEKIERSDLIKFGAFISKIDIYDILFPFFNLEQSNSDDKITI